MLLIFYKWVMLLWSLCLNHCFYFIFCSSAECIMDAETCMHYKSKHVPSPSRSSFAFSWHVLWCSSSSLYINYQICRSNQSKDAMSRPDDKEWKDAFDKEMNELRTQETERFLGSRPSTRSQSAWHYYGLQIYLWLSQECSNSQM